MKEVDGISINLAVVGSKGCGKSAITVRYLTKRFIGEYASNSDVCIDREIEIAGRLMEVHVKDTNACDWLKGPSALLGWSTAIAIVYSVTDIKSFELAVYILEKLNIVKRLEPGCVLLLGNKADLTHLRQISYEKGKQLAMQHGTHFQETSAADDTDGVNIAFDRLLMSALSVQEEKLQYNKYVSNNQNYPNPERKIGRVVRDYNRDNQRTSSIRRQRRMSTGSHLSSSSADTSSTISDDEQRVNGMLDSNQRERFYSVAETSLQRNSTYTMTQTLKSPEPSPSTSPISAFGKRKVSLPVFLEKIGFSYPQSRKVSQIPKIR